MPPPLRLALLEAPPTFRTERLLIRPLATTDDTGILRLRSHPQVVRYLGVAPLDNLSGAQLLIRQRHSERDRYESCTWSILSDPGLPLIGTLSAFKIDERHRKVEIGYSLLPQYWRRGYTTEALGAFLPWLYRTFGAHRITAEIDPANRASAALLRKLGFRREAYFREAYLVGETYTDSEIYCRLAGDTG